MPNSITNMLAATKDLATIAAVTTGVAVAAPALSATISFGSGLIEGNGSIVDFTFEESYGWFQSEWGVYNKTTGTFHSLFEEVQRNDPGFGWKENMGTCGITVLDCTASFMFEEGNEYSFFLRNINNSGHKKTMFSANELNPTQGWTKFDNQTKYFRDRSVLDDKRYQTKDSLDSDLATTGSDSITLESGMDVLIGFEDQGIDTRANGTGDYFHGDWNDFLIAASLSSLVETTKDVSEPIAGDLPAVEVGGETNDVPEAIAELDIPGLDLPAVEVGGETNDLPGAIAELEIPGLDLPAVEVGEETNDLPGAISELEIPGLDLPAVEVGEETNDLPGAIAELDIPIAQAGGDTKDVPEPITGLVLAAAGGGTILRRAKKKSSQQS